MLTTEYKKKQKLFVFFFWLQNVKKKAEIWYNFLF